MAKQQSQEQPGNGLSTGAVIDGRYKVVRFIGQGGNGLVHEVEHVRTGRRLALKSLVDESGYGRLEQEARATCLMRNEHAVRITDMGRTESTGSFLVMELLEGQSLRALLEEAGQIPLELCVNIALQVCECLTEAHGHGIVHRDLKPENIYLCESEWPGQYNVRVLDFGVVKISNEGPIPSSSLTRTGSTVGTPYYMSLEQLRNPSTVDARADIYALGVVLYESLSGRKPFQAETIGDLVYALCSGPPTHLNRLRPDLPSDICDAVMRALSTKREDRQASMTELAAVLLSHGNPAFGVWVRVNGKRPALALAPASGGAAAPARSMRSTMSMQPGSPAPSPAPPSPAAPSGIPRPVAAPSPLAPAVGIVANSGGAPSNVTPSGVKRSPQTSMTEAFVLPDAPAAKAAQPSPEQKLMPDVEVPTRIRPERPDISLSGDRDTPTEMFVKGRHDAQLEAPSRDTPTRGIPMPTGGPSDSQGLYGGLQPPNDEDDFGTMRFNPDAPPGQALPPTPAPSQSGGRQASEMLGTMRLPESAEVAEVRASLASKNILGVPGAPHNQPDIRATARLPQDGPSFGPPPMGQMGPMGQGQMGPMGPMGPMGSQTRPPLNMMTLPPGLGTATMPPGMNRQKPGWQLSLDSALVGVGRFFERLVGPAVHRVRTAPPQTQLVLAAVAASFVAAILVIVIYIMIG